MESVVWVQGLVENRFGNSEEERHQGRVVNGAILSCSGLVNLAIFWRVWGGFLLGVGVVGIGGGVWGGVLFRHWAGRHWTTALDSGSLLSQMVYRLVMRST